MAPFLQINSIMNIYFIIYISLRSCEEVNNFNVICTHTKAGIFINIILSTFIQIISETKTSLLRIKFLKTHNFTKKTFIHFYTCYSGLELSRLLRSTKAINL